MRTIIFHADLDAFYASVEQLDDPALAGLPVVVGALPGRRGVVSACSYEARAFGIHSALPISTAVRLCPHARFLPVRMERYHQVSEQVMGIFRSFAPEVRQISVDEAFLDLSGTEAVYGSPPRAAAALKRMVRDRTGLAVSIGVGANRYIAKLASARSKPDGLLFVEPGTEEAFLDGLSLFSLWGVGGKTGERLRSLGFTDVPSLRAMPRERLQRMMGAASGAFLYEIVRGRDPGIFGDAPKTHSLSGERTYGQDVLDVEVLKTTLLELAEELRFRLMSEGVRSRTVQLKLRYEDFETTTVRETLERPPESIEELYAAACALLERKLEPGRPVRLVGLAAVNALPASESPPPQGELFAEKDDRRSRVEEAVLDLRRRRGAMVTKARLLGRRDEAPE